MPKGYVHLSLDERDIITTMLSEQRSLGDIAQALGRSKSTISRELTRNASPEYRLYLSHRAHGRAAGRRQHASRRRRLKNNRIIAYGTAQLTEGWSPEQIAGRIACDHPGLSISHEAIYQYLYHPDTADRQDLIRCLRRAHRKRKTKGIGCKECTTKIPNRVPIDRRPPAVDNRRQFGYGEGDSRVSRKARWP